MQYWSWMHVGNCCIFCVKISRYWSLYLSALSDYHNHGKGVWHFVFDYWFDAMCSVLKPEDHEDQWSLNAHLTPGPDIYFNTFIHVYSPRAETDNTLGTNVDVNRKPLSLCPFVASFKTISLKSDFMHVFFLFFFFSTCIKPRVGQTTHWGQNVDYNKKAFSLCPYGASFKMISSKSDFMHIFNDFIHVYSPGARA